MLRVQGIQNNSGRSFHIHITHGLILCLNMLMLTIILEVGNTEHLFFYVRQRQCQYSAENTNRNALVQTHQPAGISRFQASPIQSQILRNGRPSGIPIKTPPNNHLRQGKVNQPRQQEGSRGSTAKSLNYVVVSQVSIYRQFLEKRASL
jgi:hypothetical protein